MEIKKVPIIYFLGIFLLLLGNVQAEDNVIIHAGEVIFTAEDNNLSFNVTPNTLNFTNINITNESITFDKVGYDIDTPSQKVLMELIKANRTDEYSHNIKTESTPEVINFKMSGLYEEYEINYLGFPISAPGDNFSISGITTFSPLNFIFNASEGIINFTNPNENGTSFYSERNPYVEFNGSAYTEAGVINQFIVNCYNTYSDLIFTYTNNTPSYPSYTFNFANNFTNDTGFINCTAIAVKDTLNITKDITFEIKEIVYRNFTAYDLYDGKLVTDFNVTLTTSFDSRQFNTTTGYIGALELFDAETLISVVGGGYHNTFTILANDTSTLPTWINASLYQAKLTVEIINAQSGELLSGQNLTIYNNSAEYNFYDSVISATGSETYYVGLHDYQMSVNGTTINYTTSSFQINETGDYTAEVLVLGAFTIWLYDEATKAEFNVSSPDSIVQETVCEDETVIARTIASITDPFIVPCVFNKIRFVITYPDDTYTRTLLPLAFNYTDENVSIYLIDLRTSQAVLNSFEVYDLNSEYENLRVYFSKNIEGTEYIITSDYINVEESMSATLLLGAQYNVIIEADNYPTTVLGFYDAITAGEKVIRLFEIKFESEPSGAWTENFWQAEVDKDIGNGRIKVRYVVNYTDLATLYIFNESSNNISDLLYSAVIASSDNGTFLYDVPLAYENYTFETVLSVNKSIETESPQRFSKVQRVKTKIELSPVASGDLKEYKLNIFLMLLLSVITLIFSIKTADIGAIIFIGFTGMFYFFEWVALSRATLGLAIIITVINFIKKKDLRQ